MNPIRFTIALVVGILSVAFAPTAQAGRPVNAAPTAIRASAILTTSNVLSTTITVPQAGGVIPKAVHIYADFTIGSLTNVILTPAGAAQDNPVAASYYLCPDVAKTITATGAYHYRVALEEFGGAQYIGIFAKGTGTVTSSAVAVSYKFEY